MISFATIAANERRKEGRQQMIFGFITPIVIAVLVAIAIYAIITMIRTKFSKKDAETRKAIDDLIADETGEAWNS